MNEPPQQGLCVPVKVIECHDGDTLTIEFEPHRAAIRLLDCWAPEVTGRQKPMGLQSRDHLRSLVEGKQAVVFIPHATRVQDLTTMGRVLGHLFVDGKSVSELQVEAGHAAVTKEQEEQMFGPAK